MAAALIAEQRAHRRAVTMLTGEISTGAASWAAKIRNLSIGGALVQADCSARIGAPVVLSRGPRRAAGIIRWEANDGFGIQFDDPVELADWLELQGSTSRGSSGKGAPKTDGRGCEDLSKEIIGSRAAEELGYISRMIEGVAKVLSEDPILRLRHAARIQELCVAEQMLNDLTAVLDGGCSPDAVLASVTGAMRHRLLRARLLGIDSRH